MLGTDASTAALLLAIAPAQLKGAVLYCESHAAGESWLDAFRALLPAGAPEKRVPGHASDERLLGGLDFAATMVSGHAVSDRGILAQADGGCVVLSGATTRRTTYAHIARVLDEGVVSLERDAMSEVHTSVFSAIVLQTVDDEPVPECFADRAAFHVVPDARALKLDGTEYDAKRIADARLLFDEVHVDDASLVALAEAAARLAIDSPRPALLAVSAARAHAALHLRPRVQREDIECAARLVLAPRARRVQPPEQDEQEVSQEQTPSTEDGAQAAAAPQATDAHTDGVSDENTNESVDAHNASADMLVRTARAALPAGLLTSFATRSMLARGAHGRAGNNTVLGVRGRQVGVRRGDPRGGARLDLVATLRAAIPMQRIRRQERQHGGDRAVELRRDDFRIRSCVTPPTTTVLLVVDASGSSARQRLAEAKGAVETLLAESYARRDRVALICFRGTSAELVLAPTHALARARRAISGLPAGGGTPLASALDLASSVLHRIARSGGDLLTVVLTDGKANVARDGHGGRARAFEEAMDAAQRLRQVCRNVLWVDTSPRAEASSRELASHAGARYLLLPQANASQLSDAVRSAEPVASRVASPVTSSTAFAK